MTTRTLANPSRVPKRAGRNAGLSPDAARTKSHPSGQRSVLAHSIRSAIDQVLRTPGRPLDGAARRFLEQRIGAAEPAGVITRTPRPAAMLPLVRADDPRERAADRAADRALRDAADFRVHAPAFAADFSRVRIHAGPAASAAARAIRAQAFSFGDDIVFGEGAFRPGTDAGLRLLAHEIAHVAQQAKTMLFRKAMPDQDLPPGLAGEADDKSESSLASQLQTPQIEGGTPGATAVPTGPAAPVNPAGPPAPSPTVAPAAATNALTPAPGTGPSAQAAVARDASAQPKAPGDLPTSDLGLIDEELAEHERWGAAAKQVGAAGSKERAAFIAEKAGEGSAKGFEEGVVQGAKTAIAMKIAEKAIAKAAVAIATRLGAQAAKFTPLPGIGAVIGGVMAGIDLAKRDWSATGKAIEGFGKGADVYEQLANSIEAISTVIEVATQVANVIAGILGGITVIMWIAAVATAGVISPMAATLTSISLAIGIGTMVLDGINAVVLKELITMFRALHAFASDADPRDVVKQGEAIEGAAGAATGFVGGLVGAKAAEKGMHIATPKPPPRIPGHPNPPPAGGEGPLVKAEPPKEAPGAGQSAKPATDAAPVREGPPSVAPAEIPAAPKVPAETAAPSPGKPAELEIKAVPEKAGAEPQAKPEAKTEAKPSQAAAATPEAKPAAQPEPAPAKPAPAPEEAMGGAGEGPKPPVEEGKAAKPAPDPRDVAEFEARQAAFEAGKKLQTGEVKAKRGGKELPPPTGEVLEKLTGNSKEAKELRLKYATKQGGEAGKILLENVRARSEAAAGGVKGGHFGEASQRLVPEVGFHQGKIISVGVEPGGQPKGARTADLNIAKEPVAPARWGELKGKGGSGVFEQSLDMKLGGGRIPDKPGFKKQSGGVAATELTPFTKGLKPPVETSVAEVPVTPGKAAVEKPSTPAPPATPVAVPPAAATEIASAPLKTSGVPATPDMPPAPAVTPPVATSLEASTGGHQPAQKILVTEAIESTGLPGGKGPGPRKSGVSAGEPPVSEIEQVRLEEIGEKRRMAGGPPVEREFAQGIEEQRPKAMRPGEGKLMGRSQVADPVKKSLRRQAAKQFGRQMQEALKDEGKHTALTQETLKHLTPAQQDYVRRTGRMPKGFEFHHLMTIADFPEFGHLAESGMALPKDVHLQAGHGGDTTRPVEAATLVDPGAMEWPGFTIDPEARKGHRAKAKNIAEGSAATPEKRGGVDVDLIKERRFRIQELKRRRNPAPGDAEKIRQLENEISVLEKLIASARDKPPGGGSAARKTGPSAAMAAPAPAPPTGGGQARAAPEIPPAAGLGVDPDAPAGQAAATLAPLQPKVSRPTATAVQAGTQPKAATVAPPVSVTPAAPASAAKVQPGIATPATVQSAAGALAGTGSVTPAATSRAAPPAPAAGGPPVAAGAARTAPGERAEAARPTGGGGTAPAVQPSPAGQQAAPVPPPAIESSAPVVERVNPAYQAPPATPDDLVSLRNQIIDTLAARVAAERFAYMMGTQKRHHEANEKPLADMKEGTGEAITATDAHQKAIANRDAANERKKAEESKAHSKVDDYASRAGRLTSLTVPLKGLAKFTGLARSLPDKPNAVLRFKNGVLKMNTDATKFLSQLDQMDATMTDQKAQQAEREKGVQADAATLKQTGDKANQSAQSLQDAKQTTEDFDQKNKERKEDAANQQKGAQHTAGTLASQARQKEQQAVSLAAAMQFWARGHAKARADAIEQTRKRLVDMGYRITEVKER